MKLTLKTKDRRQWHRWFAWYPVLIDNGEFLVFVWLTHVERRCEYLAGDLLGGTINEYRAAK